MGGDNGAADGEEGEALPEPPGKKRRKGAAEEGDEDEEGAAGDKEGAAPETPWC